MDKKEKVIKGLETCIAANDPAAPESCESCPYVDDLDCDTALMEDALNVIGGGEADV